MTAGVSTSRDLGPRFRFIAGRPADWLPADELLVADLSELLLAHARSRGTENTTVAASLFVAEYAGWVVRPLLAARHRDDVCLDPRPGHFAWQVRDGRLDAVAHDGTRAADQATDDVVTTALSEHLEPLITQVRRHARVSSRTLWGNVAGSVAASYRLLSWHTGDPARHVDDADRVLRTDRLAGLCTPTVLTAHGGDWLCPERRTCCLAYQVSPEATYCASCSLLPADERRERLFQLIDRHRTETP